jgi:hypothetical protein
MNLIIASAAVPPHNAERDLSALPMHHSIHQCGFAAASAERDLNFRCATQSTNAAVDCLIQLSVSITGLCGGRAADVD